MITTELIIKTVKDLALASPENKYNRPNPNPNGCSYVHGVCTNGSTGCIFGQALQSLGFSAEDLLTLERYGLNSFECTTGISWLLGKLEISVPPAHEQWMLNAQQMQDFGNTWIECIANADKHYPIPTV